MKTKYFLLVFVVCFWTAFGAFGATITVPDDQPTIEAAIAAASTGDEILVKTGTYDYTSSSTVSVNVTDLTIRGEGTLSTIFQTAGSSYLFSISSSGVTIQDLKIEKTDKTTQDIIYIGANDVTIKDNLIVGQFVIGDGHVDRGLEVAAVTGLDIQGNTIHSLRQPAYINAATGSFTNNDVYNTKGWVIVSNSNLTITGNSWGNGSLPNYYDIAVLNDSPPGANNYPDIVSLSAANNDAIIENQAFSPALLSIVHVDASVATTGNGSIIDPYKTIAEAIPRVAVGGTINVADGSYTLGGTLDIDKSLLFQGESKTGVSIDASGNGTGYGIKVEADDVTLSTFTLLPPIVSGSEGTSGGGGYPIHAVFDHSTSPYSSLQELTLEYITIANSNRTAFDIHGYDGVTLDNLTATGSQYGNAIQVTGCTDVTITNSTTLDNTWGGIAVYCSNSSYLNRGSDNVTIDFSGNSIGEFVYVEDEFGLTNTNINLSGWTYGVNNDYAVDADYTGYIDGPLADALTFGANLNAKFGNEKSIVFDPVGDTKYVGTGMSIQAAIDAADPGNTVDIDAGTYTENIDVNKWITLLGAGSDAAGTIITQTGGSADPDAKVGVVQLAASGNSDTEPILLQDLRIEPDGMAGISVGRFTQATAQSVSYVKLDNVKVVGTNTNPSTEQERGLYVDLTSILTNLVVNDCAFDNLTYGWYAHKEVSADASTVQHVTVTNTTFNHNNHKGIYAEKLSDATFTGCTADGNGFDSSALPSYFQEWSAGIDLNLKAGTYANITFDDCTITNNATDEAKEGVGLTVKGRDDGSTYGAFPATVDNVVVTGCTITGNERGVRFGEPGKDNATPTNVVVEDCKIHSNTQHYAGADGSAYGGVINMTLAQQVDASPNWWGPSSPPVASSQVYGDVVYYPCWAEEAMLNLWAPVYNVTQDTYHASIQDAIDATTTVDNDVIQVESADFTEPGLIRITKSLTIQGQGKTATTVKCNVNTANGGHDDDASAWILGSPGKIITLKDMTLDATGKDVKYAVRFQDSGEVNSVVINEIKTSASQYYGVAIQVLDGNVDVKNCTFTEIGRIGVHYRNGVISGATISGLYDNNDYTGKGDGDWLDYALDISGGTTITVTNSKVSGNTGIALSDGSTSGGVMATTYFPYGLNVPNAVTIENCTLTGNYAGVVVGYDANDVSVVVANYNDLSGNVDSGVGTSAPLVDASGNWWGDTDPTDDIDGDVDYTPWLKVGTDQSTDLGFQPDMSYLYVSAASPQAAATGRIQEGVDMVSGSTLDILAGTYEEQITITKDLLLDGAGVGSTIVQSPTTLATTFTTSYDHYPVITVEGADVTIQEITIDGLGRGNNNYKFEGIAYHNAAGTIKDCELKDIKDTPFSGAQHGVALYVYNEDGTDRTVNVTDNVITGFQKNAMALNAGETTLMTVSVTGNSITGAGATDVTAQNGIQVWGRLVTGVIDNNTITGIGYDNSAASTRWVATSILNYYATLDITNNNVTGQIGIYNYDGAGLISDNDLTIQRIGLDGVGIIATDPISHLPAPYGDESSAEVGGNVVMGTTGVTLDVDIKDNNVQFDGGDNTDTIGIEVDAGYSENDIDIAISGNSVQDFNYGMGVWKCESDCGSGLFTSIEIHTNLISGNTIGMDSNVDYVTVDATGNWWGDATGPYDNKTLPGTPDYNNPGGTGDPVSSYVEYDPWLNGNIVWDPDPATITSIGGTTTIAVKYLGGGSAPLYGYDIEFSWDESIATAGTGNVSQGDLFPSGSGVSTFLVNKSGNTITVNSALLGDSDGENGPGTLFTVTFTAASSGYTDLTFGTIQLRDKLNADITGVGSDDGRIIVDTAPPTVVVAITNNTLSFTDDFIKDSDNAIVTATITEDGVLTASDITADLSPFGLGTAVNPDSYVDATGIATWDIASVSCTPANGTLTITVTVEDMGGNIGTGSDDITADNILPTKVTGLVSNCGHKKVSLAWDDMSGTDANPYGVIIRYRRWNDYPKYDAAAPAYPSSVTDGDGSVSVDPITGVTSYVHAFASDDRDIYYYTAFVMDWAGNIGTVADGDSRDRSTNYYLADLGSGYGDIPGDSGYDGYVDFDDLSFFSGLYWKTDAELDDGKNEAEANFGPTIENKTYAVRHRLAIPDPNADNEVGFEDLMVLSMNYGQVAPKSGADGKGRMEDHFALELNGTVIQKDENDELVVLLYLANDGREVKGASVKLNYDANCLALKQIEKGRLFGSAEKTSFFNSRSGNGWLQVDGSILGQETTIDYSGALAMVHFDILDPKDAEIRFESYKLRDGDNNSLTAQVSDMSVEDVILPDVFAMAQNYPNPFNPETTIKYQLPKACHVELVIYNSRGQQVKTLVNEVVEPGRYQVVWNGLDNSERLVSSGMYYYRIKAGDFNKLLKMVFLK